jgi:8-oxo-dGTP pyrophosphatase MutT (NUDIX family)
MSKIIACKGRAMAPGAYAYTAGVDSGDEIVDLVDDHDRVIGTVTRREMRAERLLHRCTYVIVRNSRGDVYVHRRTDTKDVNPGLYDVTAGGVCASGEPYDACAARELEEELGIAGATLEFVFMHRYEGLEGRALGAVYAVEWDGPIRHQESEVAWGAFVGLEALCEMMGELEFCPDGQEVFERWLGDSRMPALKRPNVPEGRSHPAEGPPEGPVSPRASR